MSIAHQNAHTIIRDIFYLSSTLSAYGLLRLRWFINRFPKYFLDCKLKSWPSAMLPVMNLSMRRRTR